MPSPFITFAFRRPAGGRKWPRRQDCCVLKGAFLIVDFAPHGLETLRPRTWPIGGWALPIGGDRWLAEAGLKSGRVVICDGKALAVSIWECGTLGSEGRRAAHVGENRKGGIQ